MRHHRDAGIAQHREEALRVADPGHGVHALPGERRQRLGTPAMQGLGGADLQAHRPLAERFMAAEGRQTGLVLCLALAGDTEVDDPEIAIGRAFQRLAQRTGRQHEPVAERGLVDDRDLEVAAQAVVLQAVVADHDVAAGLGQRLRRGDAVLQAVGGEEDALARERRARLLRVLVEALAVLGDQRRELQAGREIEVVVGVVGHRLEQPHLLQLREPLEDQLVGIAAQVAADDVGMRLGLDQAEDAPVVPRHLRVLAVPGGPPGRGEPVDPPRHQCRNFCAPEGGFALAAA